MSVIGITYRIPFRRPARGGATRAGGRSAVLVSLSRAMCNWPGEPADMPALARDAIVGRTAPAPGRGLSGGLLAIAILLTAQA